MCVNLFVKLPRIFNNRLNGRMFLLGMWQNCNQKWGPSSVFMESSIHTDLASFYFKVYSLRLPINWQTTRHNIKKTSINLSRYFHIYVIYVYVFLKNIWIWSSYKLSIYCIFFSFPSILPFLWDIIPYYHSKILL